MGKEAPSEANSTECAFGLAFDRVLGPSGWQSPAVVGVDGAGVVSDVLGAAPPGMAIEHVRGVAIPGMPNVHSHSFQRAMAGRAERRVTGRAGTFFGWREAMYDLALRLEPEDVEAIAAQAFAEMLEGGFTSVAEFHYLHHAPGGRPYAEPAEMSLRVLAAAETAGIALTLCPVLYAHAGIGRPPEDRQRRFVHVRVDGFLRLVEKAREHGKVGVAAHSLRAVSASELAELLGAVDSDTPIHIHVAEQRREVEECVAALGASPVAWLLANADVDERFCLVHATHATERELEGVAKSGAVVGLCPITEANLGDGTFAAAALVDAGGAFGIGSDSNTVLDAPRELALLEYTQRLSEERRVVLSGAALYEPAARAGARALGIDAGALAPGARADWVVLDPEHPALVGHGPETLLDAYLFAGGRGAITDVYVGGRRVVENGRHVRRDAILARYRAAIERLYP